nr:MAG TPA: hypothetical protein [Caudoviricetes sp.]
MPIQIKKSSLDYELKKNLVFQLSSFLFFIGGFVL